MTRAKVRVMYVADKHIARPTKVSQQQGPPSPSVSYIIRDVGRRRVIHDLVLYVQHRFDNIT